MAIPFSSLFNGSETIFDGSAHSPFSFQSDSVFTGFLSARVDPWRDLPFVDKI